MSGRAETSDRQPAFLLAAFFAYEAAVILVLAVLWDEGTIVIYGVCALAAAGYFACGLTGRPWTMVCLALPLPVALAASEWLGAGSASAGNDWSLAGTWLIWTFLPFLPAWVAGFLLGSLARESQS